MATRRIRILGTPFNGLKSAEGRENPSDGLRSTGLTARLAELIDDTRDLGDINGIELVERMDPTIGIFDFDEWRRLITTVHDSLSSELADDAFVLVLGGDCALLPGLFAHASTEGARRTGLVYLDGHADYHTIETSPTGDPADLVLAALTGRAGIDLQTIAPGFPIIADSDVAVIGIRSHEQIEATRVSVWDAVTFRRLGYRETARQVADACHRLWIHLDVDVFDPSLVPVLYPEPGGLSIRDVAGFLHQLARSSRIAGMDVCCYHPDLDQTGRAAALIAQLAFEFISQLCKGEA
jgi:arginase